MWNKRYLLLSKTYEVDRSDKQNPKLRFMKEDRKYYRVKAIAWFVLFFFKQNGFQTSIDNNYHCFTDMIDMDKTSSSYSDGAD